MIMHARHKILPPERMSTNITKNPVSFILKMPTVIYARNYRKPKNSIN